MSLHTLRRLRLKGLALYIRPISTQTCASTFLHALHHSLLSVFISTFEQLLEEVIRIRIFLLLIVTKLIPVLGTCARGSGVCWTRLFRFCLILGGGSGGGVEDCLRDRFWFVRIGV